jgi:hypothetical protein
VRSLVLRTAVIALALAVAAPTASATVGQEAAQENPPSGWWEGTLTQTNPDSEYPVVVRIVEGTNGEEVTTIYPSLGCGGELEPISGSVAQGGNFLEDIVFETFEDYCIDGGIVSLALLDDGTLSYRWSSETSNSEGEAVLSRAAGDS